MKKLKSKVKAVTRYLNFQRWKIKVFYEEDPDLKRKIEREMYHAETLKRTVALLDRHTPDDVKYDDEESWFVGTVPHDWVNRSPRVKEKR